MSAVLVHESGGLRFMKPSRDVETLQLVVNARWWKTKEVTHRFQRFDQQPFFIRNVRLEGGLLTVKKRQQVYERQADLQYVYALPRYPTVDLVLLIKMSAKHLC